MVHCLPIQRLVIRPYMGRRRDDERKTGGLLSRLTVQRGCAHPFHTRNRTHSIMHPLLLSALIQVESGGNDQAKGRHGELGPLQIKSIMVRDVNRFARTRYTHQQVTNRQVSIDIAQKYLAHYGPNLSDESLARIWQGGPRGHRKSSSRAYARRVMRELQSMDDANRTSTENHHFTVR